MACGCNEWQAHSAAELWFVVGMESWWHVRAQWGRESLWRKPQLWTLCVQVLAWFSPDLSADGVNVYPETVKTDLLRAGSSGFLEATSLFRISVVLVCEDLEIWCTCPTLRTSGSHLPSHACHARNVIEIFLKCGGGRFCSKRPRSQNKHVLPLSSQSQDSDRLPSRLSSSTSIGRCSLRQAI